MTEERRSLEVIASKYNTTAHWGKLATVKVRPRCSTRIVSTSAIPPVETPKRSIRR